MIIPSAALIGAGSGIALADCDTSSLSGPYAGRTQGAVIGVLDSSGALHPLASPQMVSGVSQIGFDGNGSFVRSDVAVTSGVAAGSPTPLSDDGFRTGQSGSYTVDVDCTGTISLMVPGGTEIDFAIVLADSGHTVHAVVTKEHIPGLPAAMVPAGTVGVNVLLDMTQVYSRKR